MNIVYVKNKICELYIRQIEPSNYNQQTSGCVGILIETIVHLLTMAKL